MSLFLLLCLDAEENGNIPIPVNDHEDAHAEHGGFEMNELEHGEHGNLVFFSTSCCSLDLSCSSLDS
jgi:hypothetical protein